MTDHPQQYPPEPERPHGSGQWQGQGGNAGPGGPGPGPGYPEPGYPGQMPGYGNGPTYQPQVMSPHDQRLWAMLAHLSPFVGLLVSLPVLGPLVIYLVHKDRGAYVRGQSAESLNFQLTVLIGYLISAVLFLVVVGIFTLGAIFLASVVLQIIAAVAANRGDDFRYPLTIRFVH